MGDGQGEDAFMCRMDQLTQKLSKWKTTRSATPLRNDSGTALALEEQRGSSRKDASPSRHFKPSPSSQVPPSSGRSRGSHSPSRRGSISILSTYDRVHKVANAASAVRWLCKASSKGEEGGEAKKAPGRSQSATFRPIFTEREGAEGAEALRSPKRFDQSLSPSVSPASRLSRRSAVDKQSESNPFHIERCENGDRTRPASQNPRDRPEPTAFNTRMEALQHRVWQASPAMPSDRHNPMLSELDFKNKYETSPFQAAVADRVGISPEPRQWQTLARASPGTAHSDETLASRVGQLEESLGRIEMMLQQVLESMAANAQSAPPAATQHASGREATACAWTGQARQSSTLPRMPSRTPSKILAADSVPTPQAKLDRKQCLRPAVATPDAAAGASTLRDAGAEESPVDGEDSRKASRSSPATSSTRSGFFKWPLDIAGVREELGLPKKRRQQA
ncbi:unnamed protein product [Symbiodinium sp. CCMP2456]|nr:unnamed protein product [Symbiodinium sp. CCMP2456]